MLWADLLADVRPTVNQELLLRNEYLAAENWILRGQIRARLLLSDGEKVTLAEIAQRLGRLALGGCGGIWSKFCISQISFYEKPTSTATWL